MITRPRTAFTDSVRGNAPGPLLAAPPPAGRVGITFTPLRQSSADVKRNSPPGASLLTPPAAPAPAPAAATISNTSKIFCPVLGLTSNSIEARSPGALKITVRTLENVGSGQDRVRAYAAFTGFTTRRTGPAAPGGSGSSRS